MEAIAALADDNNTTMCGRKASRERSPVEASEIVVSILDNRGETAIGREANGTFQQPSISTGTAGGSGVESSGDPLR